jgi:hypothetical protein
MFWLESIKERVRKTEWIDRTTKKLLLDGKISSRASFYQRGFSFFPTLYIQE